MKNWEQLLMIFWFSLKILSKKIFHVMFFFGGTPSNNLKFCQPGAFQLAK